MNSLTNLIWNKIFRSDKLFLSLVLIVSAVLLGYTAISRSFWMDETAVLEYFYKNPNPIEFLKNYFIVPDNHPPLYYLLVIVVYNIFSIGELGVRLVSIIASLGVVCVVYLITSLLFEDKRIARLSVIFTAISPFFLQYGQMARYHSLTAFLFLISVYFLIKFFYQEQSGKNLLLFFVFSLLTAYTDLPSFVYLMVCANVWYLINQWKVVNNKKIITWLGGQVILCVLFLPVVWLYYTRMKNGDGDFAATSLLGSGIIDWFSDFAFHFYQFFYGETILPWNYLIFSLGLVVLLIVTVKVFRIIKAWNDKHLILMFFWVIGLVACNTIFLNILNPRFNFIVYPKYVFSAFPLFVILIVGAINSLRNRGFAIILFIIFALVQIVGTTNLIVMRNYLNASYFRGFESFEFVKEASNLGECVLINGDMNIGLYDFYKNKYFYKLEPISVYDDTEFKNIKSKTRCWFFSTGSDDQNTNHSSESKAPKGFKIVDSKYFTPIDLTLLKVKEKILGRDGYEFKYGVFLLEKE